MNNSLNKLQELLENKQLRDENNKTYYQKLSTLSAIVNNEYDKQNGIKIIDDDTAALDENSVLRRMKLQQYYETGTITNIKQMRYKNTHIAICCEDQPMVDEMLDQLRTLEVIYNNTGDKRTYREIKHIRGIIFALCYIDNITTCNRSKANNAVVNTCEADYDYNYKNVVGMLKNYYQYNQCKSSHKITVYMIDLEQALQVTEFSPKQKEVLIMLINGESIGKDNSRSLKLCIDKLVDNLLNNYIYKMKRVNHLNEFFIK